MSNPATSRNVSVLLAVYNGARYLEEQLRSLTENDCKFTLEWIDDCSSDDSAAVVRRSCGVLGIAAREWRAPRGLGVPGIYFFLLQNVAADVYLLCDQDDIWEPHKIDAAVACVTQRPGPVLSFSDPKVFHGAEVRITRRYLRSVGTSVGGALQPGKAFVFNPCVGNTVAFDRSLRELFMQHALLAQRHAAMHDWWLYLLALVFGEVRFAADVPTTLYRQHASNKLGVSSLHAQLNLPVMWRKQKSFRRLIARQARGFLQVLDGVSGAAAVSLRDYAGLIARVDQRLSAAEVLHLWNVRAVPVSRRRALLFLLGCLASRVADAG